ncbi:MAG: hypothetical protein HS108_05220 [Planctomycetes bacterium]|nr:hypothetical protein [Planctomycetota bacterium]MCL4730847.1 hypothetical protein [Planctomycetota bacterium]
MTTTHPEISQSRKTRRGPGDLAVAGALALGPLAFVFGGFAALPALPGVVSARLRAPALAYFLGVVVCTLASLAGFNPWAVYARERALDELESALGARPTWAAWHHHAAGGELRLENIEVELAALGGRAELVQARVVTGPGFVFGASRPRLVARGLRVVVDGNSDFGAFFAGLEGKSRRELELDIESIELEVKGPEISAGIGIARARGTLEPAGLRLDCAPRQMDLTLWGRTHNLALRGTAAFERRDGVTGLSLDLRAVDGQAAALYAHGTLQSQAGPGGLVVTLDYMDLGEVWARYRKIDVFDGNLRATARVSGTLRDLRVALDAELAGFRYFHRAVMALDETRAFDIPQARVVGGLRLVDGTRLSLEQLQLLVPDGTLCTGPALSTRGEALLTLNGDPARLTGTLEATVTSGRAAQAISWSPVTARRLADLQPNIVQVAEQFSDLTLDYTIDVQALTVACEPVSGVLSGALSGRLHKQPGLKEARLGVGGRLQLAQGRFAFCAAEGTLEGTIEFNPAAPSFEAAIRGGLKGTAGDVPLAAEVTGRLSHPGLVFSGVTMHPDDLGRLIAAAGNPDAAEKARRTEALSRLCGPAAALAGNPFVAHKAGRVSFSFKP